MSVAVGNGADKSMTALLSDSADIALLGTEAGLYVYAEGKADYPKTFAQLTQRAGNFLVSRKEEPDFQWSDLEGKIRHWRQIGRHAGNGSGICHQGKRHDHR